MHTPLQAMEESFGVGSPIFLNHLTAKSNKTL